MSVAKGPANLPAVLCPIILMVLFAPSFAAPPVILSGSGWVGDAPTKVAEAQDYFNAPGVSPVIEVVYDDSGKASLERLLAGDADFALAATTPVAQAILDGQLNNAPATEELVILASVALSSRSHYVLTDATLDIREPRDLVGKRVGVMLGTSAHFGWSRFVEFHRLPPAEFTLVDGPTPQLGALLLAQDVDAVVTWDPWGAATRAQMAERAVVFPTRQLYTVNWLLVTTRERVARMPDAADRVVAAYLRAIEFIEASPDQARRLHARSVDTEESKLLQLEQGFVWSLRLNWSVLANMEMQLAWLRTQPPYVTTELPAPSRYLEAGPLSRVAPRWLLLPSYLYTADFNSADGP